MCVGPSKGALYGKMLFNTITTYVYMHLNLSTVDFVLIHSQGCVEMSHQTILLWWVL